MKKDTKHLAWPPLQCPSGGYLGCHPLWAYRLEDEFLLGERVAAYQEDEDLWGADGVVILYAAPGDIWDGK